MTSARGKTRTAGHGNPAFPTANSCRDRHFSSENIPQSNTYLAGRMILRSPLESVVQAAKQVSHLSITLSIEHASKVFDKMASSKENVGIRDWGRGEGGRWKVEGGRTRVATD